MKGLDISQTYFEEFGMPMLQRQFPDLLPYVAAGVFGSGSECFGFDDEVSRDHDFDPGFMLLLPGEDVVSRKRAFELERAYAKLPGEFMGVKRPKLAPVGGPRRSVMRASEAFERAVGSADGRLTLGQWLSIPSHALAEVTNGRIFYDGSGQVTAVREGLKRYPEDVRRKKLAGHLLLAGQAGQYNYARCLRHGEEAAAQLAAIEFCQHVMAAVFLLNGAYQPFYKWAFRAMRALPKLPLTAELLEYLITTGNDADMAREKQSVMEGLAADVIEELAAQGMSAAQSSDLEKHAYAVNDAVENADLRNLHILAGV